MRNATETIDLTKDAESVWDMLKIVLDYINKQTDFNKLVTNAQIGSWLTDAFDAQDIPLPPVSVNRTGNPEAYRIIKLKAIEVFVDPYMKWDETFLIFENTKSDKSKIVDFKTPENFTFI